MSALFWNLDKGGIVAYLLAFASQSGSVVMNEKIVTRFAPSPTGYLHVGGARTAIFNWLWARKNGGTFILRIEDTDQKRNTPTATAQVIRDLRWLGIDWDEGPEVGGPNGPYFQSERLDIYSGYIQQLLDRGQAYYCFETAEELNALRKAAEAKKENFTYRRPAQLPTTQDAERARSEGRPVTVRLAIPQDKPIVINDLVRGEVTFAAQDIADFIIQKNDGFPTYNFACVVDDYCMKVTHIIRGQEHLNNTPGQQVLWEALFGSDNLPRYAHMSVTMSDSGGKLSKRERPQALFKAIQGKQDINLDVVAKKGGLGREDLNSFLKGKTTPDMPAIDAMADYLTVHLPEINVVDFLKSGYLPVTMINFLALLGWNPGDDREIMSTDELIQAFDISRMIKSNSLFDRAKLMAFNTEHLKMTPTQVALRHLRDYLEAIDSPMAKQEDDRLIEIIRLCEGARTLADIDRKSRFLFVPWEALDEDKKAINKVLRKGDGIDVLKTERETLATLDTLDRETCKKTLTDLAEARNIGLGKVAQPLRVALCRNTVSISVFDAVEILGKEETLARIDKTIQLVDNALTR